MFFTKVLPSTSNRLKTAYRQFWVEGEVGLVSCKSHNILLGTKKVNLKGIEPPTLYPNSLTLYPRLRSRKFHILKLNLRQ